MDEPTAERKKNKRARDQKQQGSRNMGNLPGYGCVWTSRVRKRKKGTETRETTIRSRVSNRWKAGVLKNGKT